jgi:predicted transcriptional regulator
MSLLPTDAELGILQILWESGPQTVRDVHNALKGRSDVGYTTVLKFLQIMTEKGLVRRDTSERAHVYEAAVEENDVQRSMVTELLDRAFGGSATKLVLSALSAKRSSPDELAQIQRLLRDLDPDS